MQFGQLMPLFAELGALSNKISDNQPYRPTYSSIGPTRLFQDFLGSNCILDSKIGPLQPSIYPLELRFDSIESQVGLSEHKVSPLETGQLGILLSQIRALKGQIWAEMNKEGLFFPQDVPKNPC